MVKLKNIIRRSLQTEDAEFASSDVLKSKAGKIGRNILFVFRVWFLVFVKDTISLSSSEPNESKPNIAMEAINKNVLITELFRNEPNCGIGYHREV
jgi:hypothetical protein